MKKIVLDTNCLISSLSRHGEYYPVWKGFQRGKYCLCVSNDILSEYQEMIALKTSEEVARNVVDLLLKSRNVEFIDPHFKFHLIEADNDDNKFVDCAIAANATFIVSEDKHFEVLEQIPFPKVLVLRLREFLEMIK